MTQYKLQGPNLSTAPRMSWRTKLSGALYLFTLDYQARLDRWRLAISDAAGEPIVAGIPVVAGVDLLGGLPRASLPAGKLICVDIQNKGAAPTRNDWRERHFLMYDDTPEETVDLGWTFEAIDIEGSAA